MKKIIILFLGLIATIAFSCKGPDFNREELTYDPAFPLESLQGISFKRVEASSFAFNETKAGRLIDGATHSFEDVEPAFMISTTPISKEFYESFMGAGKWPKNGLCSDDVNALLDKIYIKTNIPCVIPTEGMYEAALRQDIITPEKKDEIVLSDGWMDSELPTSLTLAWKAPKNSAASVLRTIYERTSIEPFRRRVVNQFYLAVRLGEAIPNELLLSVNHRPLIAPELSDGKKEVFDVEGYQFTMMPVTGGQMQLGATPEQEKYAEEDEAPLRDVVIDDFKIGETEVTAGLWLAVMGDLPIGNMKSEPNKAIANVSFYRAEEFIRKLNAMTGRNFRLPSEDEWEYAARGGKKSHGYIFAGGNNAKDVAVCSYKAKKKKEETTVRPGEPRVKSKLPNELGLYDMSGNQWEWVRGEGTDDRAIQKGGSRKSLNIACRVSNRQFMGPQEKKDTFGFRLAL